MHLFQGHRTSSEPLWHVGLPPLFTQAYIHSLHRFLAHFMICDDYFMISSGFPFNVHDETIDKKVLIPCHTELMLDYGHAIPDHEEPYPQKKRKRKE